jgi:Holliday junction resolvase RusA-like endonuclease
VSLSLWLPGPTPWRREPLIGKRKGRSVLYPHPDTLKGKARWRGAWLNSERVYLEGPLSARLEMLVVRPVSHLKRDYTLSAEGRRRPWPTSRPDCDNCAKLALDALKGLAFRDDAAVVELYVSKRYVARWSECGAHLDVRVLVATPQDP